MMIVKNKQIETGIYNIKVIHFIRLSEFDIEFQKLSCEMMDEI